MKWTVPVFAAVGALPIAGAVFVACTEGDASNASDTTDEAATASKECKAVSVPPMTDPITGEVCHASTCTPDFCSRGDIAVLHKTPETRPLEERLATLAKPAKAEPWGPLSGAWAEVRWRLRQRTEA